MSFETDELFEVDISLFERTQNVPFDVYLKMSDRYVKILEFNQTVFVNVWDKIKERKVKKVYVKSMNQVEFIRFGLEVHSLSKTEERVNAVISTTKQIFNLFEKTGVTGQNCLFLKAAAEEIVVLIKRQDSLRLFLAQIQSDSVMFSHALIRTLFCLAAAKKLDWTSESLLTKITLASLFCDVSLKGKMEVVLKSPTALNKNEKDLYLNHMSKTVQEVGKFINLSSEAENAILHHHENIDGSGPLGLTKNQIYPVGHLIRIGDFISTRLIKSEHNPNPLPLNQCLLLLDDAKVFNQQITAGFSFFKKVD
jgi:HD-GYP domain-containing protein (c-di-GMP phosphodiesterase class II)